MTFFYPPSRAITSITNARNAVVTLSSSSGYIVGQKVTFAIHDPAYGMTQIDGITATVIAVDDNVPNVTVDLDTREFNAFTVPMSTNQPEPMVLPSGTNSALILSENGNILSGAMRNTLRD